MYVLLYHIWNIITGYPSIMEIESIWVILTTIFGIYQHMIPKRLKGVGVWNWELWMLLTLSVKHNLKKNKVSAKFKSRPRQIRLGNCLATCTDWRHFHNGWVSCDNIPDMVKKYVHWRQHAALLCCLFQVQGLRLNAVSPEELKMFSLWMTTS